MIFENYKISRLLLISVSAFMLLVIMLAFVSYMQSKRIQEQVDMIYNHPLKVRRALGNLKSDIYLIHWNTEGLLAQTDILKMQPFLKDIRNEEEEALRNFDILYSNYLGPKSDVDTLYSLFMACKHNREDVMTMITQGNQAQSSTIDVHFQSDSQSSHLKEIIDKLEVISNFSLRKSDELHAKSITLYKKLGMQLGGFTLLMLLLSLAIYYLLVRSIRRPLVELSRTSSKLQSGDLSARSWVNANNEFGELSMSLNSMAASLQYSVQINTMVNELTQKILLGADPKGYFSELLCALAQLTHSQLAAIYLLNDDKSSFELYHSLGGDENMPTRFSARTAEGEFGLAIKTATIQFVGNQTASKKLQFKAVSGSIWANEIITMPLVSVGEVFAIISLATIQQYPDFTLEFLKRVSGTISAHTTSMMSFKKLQEYSRLLSEQNTELETQKSALVSQSNELQQQNMELQIQKEQLNEVSRLKTSFLSNMSHELRTPLNSVIALSGVLHRRLIKLIPEEEYSYIEVIERNGKHLLALINDILDISRIEAGREEVILSRFNVCEQINEVVQMIKPQADAKSIELKVAKGACDVSIVNDADKFKHIVQNLVSNAVKFTEEGWVEIRVAEIDQYIQIQVMDSGIGISKKQLPHIFDEFRQADSSTSRKYGGTGLGLAIARKYAQILGGSLKAESVEHKGSVFILTLPLSLSQKNTLFESEIIEPLTASQNAAQATRVLSQQKPIVLLIEDSEPAIVQIKDVLLDMDFEIQVFDNGPEALSWSHDHKVDAVILDLMMPNMDGFEVLAKLRATIVTQTVPVLILTAKHITPEELRFLKGNHIFQLIQKGDVNRNDLRTTIQKMVKVTQPSTEHLPVIKPSNSGRPLLLVVEDNADNLLTVNALLAESYDVIEAYNGLDAVQMARTHQPNLILMDIALPVMDGVEAFRAIRKDPFSQHIPIIALTASAMVSDREIILAHGFDAYIAKPIDVEPFYKTINAILHGK